jgi:hypothetical protein
MAQKNKTVYLSLEELRSDKLKVSKRLHQQTKALKKDAMDMVLPSNNIFFTSDYSYMRYIGYAITAYKTFTTFRKISSFFRRRR